MTRDEIRAAAVRELREEPEVREFERLLKELDRLGAKRKEYDLVPPFGGPSCGRLRLPGYGAWRRPAR